MNVLIVEDDAVYAKAIRSVLRKQGYKISFTDNGVDAIEKFKQESFDLVITDIFIPDKEGIELIQEIREINPTVKIIAISSGGNVGRTSFLKLAEAMGANTGLEKPFGPDKIIEVINSL